MCVLLSARFYSTLISAYIAHIFICCHGKRDARCGNCGPPLYQEIQKILKDKKMQDSVDVYKCSHIGMFICWKMFVTSCRWS